MEIEKSSRHSKIIGAFGEAFLCNWLSRSGFEVTIIDHTGLDIIAYHRKSRCRLGITVKSRTRGRGKEAESVNVFFNRKRPGDRAKLRAACNAFACEPWVAVYVETAGSADLYLMSLKHYDQTYCQNKSRAVDTWKMGKKQKRAYDLDKNVQHISVEFRETNWTFGGQGGSVLGQSRLTRRGT
jgi:Holliday junction resolvase-like predicted endonuclease